MILKANAISLILIFVCSTAVLLISTDAFSPLVQLSSSRHVDVIDGVFKTGVKPFWRDISLASTGTDSIDQYMADLQEQKIKLIQLCERSSKPPKEEVNKCVRELETLGEQLGVGQGSSYSGLLAGEWELLYSPEDPTRSSPFFWAFRKAFPGQSDDIFAITDAIPAPLKEVGPVVQTITLDANPVSSATSTSGVGKLVSRIKVATLGGVATSMMTTRVTIIGAEGIDGLKLRVDTTKPEDSTFLQKLGPLGEFLNENAPPFPSGETLERVARGSSEVIMTTTYCDETLRVSRNSDNAQDAFVWRRLSFRGVSQV